MKEVTLEKRTTAEERRDLRAKEQEEHKARTEKKGVSDERMDELLEDASREAEKRGDPEKPSDHIAEWHQVFNTLHVDWAEGKIGNNRILMYMESLARSLIRALDKKEAPKSELRCGACHNWGSEAQFDHTPSGHVLICPNCGVQNMRDIESRLIERSEFVSVESIIEKRSK